MKAAVSRHDRGAMVNLEPSVSYVLSLGHLLAHPEMRDSFDLVLRPAAIVVHLVVTPP